MIKIENFALKIMGGGREGGTCEVIRPATHPKNLERARDRGLGKIPPPTAAFKEDTNMISFEFREGFGL